MRDKFQNLPNSQAICNLVAAMCTVDWNIPLTRNGPLVGSGFLLTGDFDNHPV